MSIAPTEPSDDSPVNRDRKCWGARKKMTQAIGSLARIAASEATRQKYKGTLEGIELRINHLLEQSQAAQAEMVAQAERRAFEEEHEEALTTLEFKIQKHLEFGQELLLVGSLRQLGSWSPSSGVALSWNEGDFWTCSTTVQRSEVPKLEYKYIVKNKSEADSVDFYWETGGNHNILAKPDRHMQLQDVWEFPGYKL